MAKLLGGTRIYGNATVDTFLSVGSNIAASNLTVNTVTANNWVGIYTANVIESSGSLYYSNGRARSSISAGDNSIIYYPSNGTIRANVGYITSTISSTVTGLTTSNIAEGSNLYYTNTRVISAVENTLLSNLSIAGNIEANTVVTNNFFLRGIDLTSSLITGNVTSGTSTSDILIANAFYTKAITSNTWTGLYTANVIETAGNLYFTNDRVYANVAPLLALKANVVDLTTANVIEFDGNLYFTNTRAVNAITSTTLGNISVASNITVGGGAGGTISGANLISAAYIQGNNWVGLYTTNVIEGTNLYYTNARVRSTLSGGTGVVYDTTSGQISIGQNVATTANVTFAALNVTGTTNFYGNVITHSSNNLSISDNMIYLNSGSESSNPDLGFAGNYNDGTYHHAGFFRDALDRGTWKVFENYQPEPDANIYINTSHASFRLANLAATTFYGNVQGQVSTISNFTTDNLAEGSRLYYTNTRVVTVLVPYLTTANVNEFGGNLYYTNARVISAVTPYLTTANVLESDSSLYYSNDRVYSNVISILQGNVALGNVSVDSLNANNIFANSTLTASEIITGTGNGGSITGANLISANYILANVWQGIYTANVIESDSNLYYTNDRVYANVTPLLALKANVVDLTTSNVIELDNLYFNNARAISAIVYAELSNLTVTGNITAGNILTGTGLGGTISGGNLISATYVQADNWLGLYTANVIESANNLYYSNDRVYANVSPLLDLKANIVDLTTSNVIELNNLYYTNTRVYSNVALLLTLKANVKDLTTSNVVELNNLYYTNTRVYSNVAPLLALKANVVDLTTSNVTELNNLYYTNTRVYSNVSPLLALKANVKDLTTANVLESTSNLYFTNARVVSAVVNSALSNLSVVSNVTAGNIITSGTNGTITGANLIVTNIIQANIWTGLYSSNIIEFGNLFYTNSRVYSNVIQLLPTLAGTGISIAANGLISTTTNVTAFLANLTTANIAEVASNLYFTNARVYANIAPLLTTANVNEVGSNLYYTNARVYSNIVSALASFTTSNINEGSNLYYTNDRVLSYVTTNVTTSNIAEGSNLYYTNSRVLSYVATNITTSNITEGSNLYYTNARIASYLSTANIDASFGNLTVVGNLYIKGDVNEVNSTILNVDDKNIIVAKGTPSALLADGAGLLIDGAQANLTYSYSGDKFVVTKGLDVLNGILNSTNLVSTFATVNGNAIINGNVIASNIRTNSLIVNGVELITGTGNISVNTITANVWQGIYTANVIETSGNLYFTNARVYANIAPLLTTANINEFGSNLYFTNARVYANISPLLTTANITESSSNLYFTNARVVSAVVNSTLANISVSGNVNTSNLNTNVLYANTFISTGVGIPTIDSITNINLNANGSIGGAVVIGSSPLRFRSYTTVDSGNLTPSTGDTIYNSTISGLQVWNGSAWVATGATSTSNIAEGSNLYYTNARVLAFVSANITTSNIAEGSNLYYTNTRVYSNIVSALASFTTSNINEGSNLYYTNARVYSNIVSALASFTTSNINEGSNLYYTNTRTYSNVIALLPTYTGSYTGTNMTLYGAYANTYLSTYGSFFIDASSGNQVSQISTNNLTSGVGSQTLTGNINGFYSTHGIAFSTGKTLRLNNYPTGGTTGVSIDVGGNLFASSGTASSNTTTGALVVTGGLGVSGNINASYISTSGNVYAGNLIVANSITLQNINVTSNIINGGGSVNTAYLNSSNIITGNIQASAWYGLANLAGNGLVVSTNTTSGVQTLAVDQANLSIAAIGAPAVVAYDTFNGGNKNYTLTRTVSGNNANVIMVSINGLEQIPGIDYSLTSPQSLSFAANTTLNSTIAVKYLGYVAYVTPNALVLASSTVIPTVQGQSSYLMGANVSAPEKILVMLDGLTQRPTADYTVNNTTLTFTSAPPEGSNIEIRFMGQEALALNGAANTTSYISNSIVLNGGGSRFNLGSNVSFARNIIVNVDGLAQIPVTDYNISGGNTLVFTSNVSQNSVVEVKFFGAEALGTINFNNTIVAASLTGSNGVKISSNGIITVDVLSPFLLMGA